MTVEIDVVYQGELRCQATHGPSGVQVVTDAPVDNCGKGESFSPTDLVATALGGCILTILGIVSERHGIALEGTTIKVEKHMVADPVRRIGSLPVVVNMSCAVEEKHKSLLENAAATCPVHQSLHPEIAKPITFVWK
ncbi:MAG: OsmC family protein [Planctomycetota bacterium]|nr:OsmC family protein [Planctomycetota bacterium]MDA1114196.1 OsmC family protein [Planctomycetota bacterium]